MIWELRHEHKIGLLIDIAGIPRSTYYYYSKQFDNPKPDKYAEIKAEILRIYDENKGRYGYRRITKELKKVCYQSQDSTAINAKNWPFLSCPHKAVQIVQGRSRQDRTKYFRMRLQSRQAKSEMGNRRY